MMKMKKLKSFVKPILIILIIACIIGILTLVSHYINKIPENPAGTTGNTAGNLINNGLFCEDDNVVYFSNPADSHTLYSMNPDETNVKKMTNTGIQSINSAGKYLYYFQHSVGEGSGLGYSLDNTGMYRLTKKNSDVECLTKDNVGMISLVDNDLYFQHLIGANPNTVNRISIDKSSEEMIFSRVISPACVKDSLIYYTNPDGYNYLYAYNTRTRLASLYWSHPLWNPIYHSDGYIYFMDLVTDYELHRYNPSTGEEEVLTTDRVETYNVNGNYIYYQMHSQTEPALKRMRTDGSEAEVVAYGNYHNINMTSQYVYFTEFNKPDVMYHQEIAGPVNATIFRPVEE